MRARALLLFALGACARPAPSGPVPADGILVDRTTTTYQVDMSSSAAFNRSVFEERRRADQRYWVGKTNSSVRWTWVPKSGPGGCVATDVKVTVKTVMSLPRWTPPSSTSPARREWWSRVENMVLVHERRHVQISEDGGRAVAKALREVQANDCTTLRGRANSAANREYERMRGAQAAFDKSEGTLAFPPQPR